MKLFEMLHLKGASSTDPTNYTYTVTVSMLEVYNEQIIDLLPLTSASDSSKIEVRQLASGQVDLPGLVKEPVSSIDQVMTLLSRGNKNRATGNYEHTNI